MGNRNKSPELITKERYTARGADWTLGIRTEAAHLWQCSPGQPDQKLSLTCALPVPLVGVGLVGDDTCKRYPLRSLKVS